MKNADLWKQHEEYTASLSANCRKLAFASAAIGWIFKTPEGYFPGLILASLGFTIAFFLVDILQYLLAALFLRFWTQHQEAKRWKQTNTIDGDYDKPRWLDWPAFVCLLAKVTFLLVAYALIIGHVWYMSR